MRIVRFSYKSKENWGILKDSQISVLKDNLFTSLKLTDEKFPLDKVKLLAPALANGAPQLYSRGTF